MLTAFREGLIQFKLYQQKTAEIPPNKPHQGHDSPHPAQLIYIIAQLIHIIA